MRKIGIFLTILMMGLVSCRQSNPSVIVESPEAVLKKLFPKSNEFQFDTLPKTGHIWVAFFDGTQYATALFLNDSLTKNKVNLHEIRQDCTLQNLPAPVREALKKQLGGDLEDEMLNKLEKITRYTGGGAVSSFAAETETAEHYLTLEFDESGKLVDEAKIPISALESQQKEEEGVDPTQKDEE